MTILNYLLDHLLHVSLYYLNRTISPDGYVGFGQTFIKSLFHSNCTYYEELTIDIILLYNNIFQPLEASINNNSTNKQNY